MEKWSHAFHWLETVVWNGQVRPVSYNSPLMYKCFFYESIGH